MLGVYKTDISQTPFTNGFLMTWLDSNIPRDRAIERTNRRLMGEGCCQPRYGENVRALTQYLKLKY
jgi:hypothetical protein